MAAKTKRSASSTKKASTSAKSKVAAVKPVRKGQRVKNTSKEATLRDIQMEAPMVSPALPDSKKTNTKTMGALVVLALLLGLLYYFKDLFLVATVNGKPIARAAVVTELEKQSGKEVVDNLITKELILQEAAKKGVTVSKEDVDNEVKKIEEELTQQGQTLDQILETQGLTRSDVEENLRVKLYIERILKDEVGVTDEDAKAYYDENKTLYGDAKFEDEKDGIKTTLEQGKLQEKFQTWITDLKANAKINYFKTY